MWTIAFVVFGALFIGIIVFGKRGGLSIGDIVTYEGLFTSVYGVILTFIQVWKLKSTADATNKAVEDTANKIDQMLSIAEASKYVTHLRSVKEYVTNGKLELARLRMHDIKDFMNHIAFIKNISYNKQTYKNLLGVLDSNLHSIDQALHAKSQIDIVVFDEDIERVVSFLSNIENQLKIK